MSEKTIDDCRTSRERLAFILEDIAKNGFPGSRDLDVALDAIDSEYGSKLAAEKDRAERAEADFDRQTVMVTGYTKHIVGLESELRLVKERAKKAEALLVRVRDYVATLKDT